MELGPDGTVDAVGRGHDVGLDRTAIGEDGDRARLRLDDVVEAAAQVEVLCADTLEEGGQQEALELTPVDRDLRPGIAGGQPSGLTPDLLATLRVVDQLRRGDPSLEELTHQPEGVELADRVRLEVDAHP